jgi:hypothetical protein
MTTSFQGALMAPHQSSDWEQLAERATKEMDPRKLLNLITELNQVLGARRKALARASS